MPVRILPIARIGIILYTLLCVLPSYGGQGNLTLNELCARSTEIVRVRVVSIEYFRHEGRNHIMSRIQLDVTETLKGETEPSDRITLTMIGGTMNGITTAVVGSPSFIPGEESFCFLTKIRMTNGQTNYVMPGLSHGKFNVHQDPETRKLMVVRDHDDAPLFLDQVTTALPITRTRSMNIDDFLNDIRIILSR